MSLPTGAGVRVITFGREAKHNLPPPVSLPTGAGARVITFGREARYSHHSSSLLE